MRILHVITSLSTGGAEKLMVDLLPRLQALGNEVALLVFDGKRTPFMEQLENAHVKIFALGENCSVYNPCFIFKLIPIIREFDIIHTHNTACQMFVAMANIFAKSRIITTEHNTTNRRRGKWYWKIIDHWMYSQYERIVCISELTKKNLLESLGNGDWPVSVIHNGVDVKRFHDAKPLVADTGGRYLVVMVAAFRAQKDQDTLVRAMSDLPKSEYELWLVGGDNERLDTVKHLVHDLQLEDRVKFLGVRMVVPEILQRADVIVLSSHYEGLSLSCIEAMSSGKPFIASDVEGLHDIVGGYGVLFPHEDPKSLSKSIKRCCEDRDYAYQIEQKCYARALEFDIVRMAKGYSQVYESLYLGKYAE